MTSLPAGVTARIVKMERLVTYLREIGDGDFEPVVFLHGNASSSRFYAELLGDFPDAYRAVAPDLRGFGTSERRPIDATRGLRDFADDVHAVATELGFDASAGRLVDGRQCGPPVLDLLPPRKGWDSRSLHVIGGRTRSTP